MKALKIFGYAELFLYFTFLALLVFSKYLPGDSFGDEGPKSVGEFIVMAYLVGGVTLIPSALIFAFSYPKMKPTTLETAQTLQLVLFIAVCAALLPLLYISMSQMIEYTILLSACALGFFLYFMMRKLVQQALADLAKLQLD